MTAAQGDLKVLWFLPTSGDGHYLGTMAGARDIDFDYLRQIARAADKLGYYGVLLPTGRNCEVKHLLGDDRTTEQPTDQPSAERHDW